MKYFREKGTAGPPFDLRFGGLFPFLVSYFEPFSKEPLKNKDTVEKLVV